MHKNKLPHLIISLIFSSHAIADTISIRADEWCPYNCTPGTDMPGYVIEIAQYAFESAGHTVDYQNLDWSKSIEESRAGKYDAIVGAFYSDAPDFVFPDEEQGAAFNVFFTKNDTDWHYKDTSSLSNAKTAVILDYSYGDEIDQQIEQSPNNFIIQSSATPLADNFELLIQNKADTLIEDQAVASHYLNQQGKKHLFKQAGALSHDALFIAFSPKNKQSQKYADILTSAIEELRRTGKLESILNKYGLSDWK